MDGPLRGHRPHSQVRRRPTRWRTGAPPRGFPEHVLDAVPYQVHTILTDRAIAAPPVRARWRGASGSPGSRGPATPSVPGRCASTFPGLARPHRGHGPLQLREANGIEHRLTKPNHPWTNGQVERMNRTIKDATVKRYHYDSNDQQRSHLADFLDAYNYARRLKTLSGLTPCERICKIRTSEPDRFIVDPIHQMPGLNMQRILPSWSRCLTGTA